MTRQPSVSSIWHLSVLFTACCSSHTQQAVAEHQGVAGGHDTPSPPPTNNRLLGIILAFNLAHFDSLLLIFGEYLSMCEGGWNPLLTSLSPPSHLPLSFISLLSMCEGGWNPSLLIYTTMDWTVQVEQYIQRRTFCYRTNHTLPIEFSCHNKSIGIGLSSFHRQYVADHLHSYDVFVYQEDDIVFRFAHLTAFMHESAKLQGLNASDDNIVGFQRYRREMRQVRLEWYGRNSITRRLQPRAGCFAVLLSGCCLHQHILVVGLAAILACDSSLSVLVVLSTNHPPSLNPTLTSPTLLYSLLPSPTLRFPKPCPTLVVGKTVGPLRTSSTKISSKKSPLSPPFAFKPPILTCASTATRTKPCGSSPPPKFSICNNGAIFSISRAINVNTWRRCRFI